MTSPTLPQIVEPTDGRSPAEAGPGCQPSASAPVSAGSSQSGIPNAWAVSLAVAYREGDARKIGTAVCVSSLSEADAVGRCFALLWNTYPAGDLMQPVVCPFVIAAQGIEAATADETRSGSAEGESPVAEGDAPEPNDRTHLLSLGEGV